MADIDRLLADLGSTGGSGQHCSGRRAQPGCHPAGRLGHRSWARRRTQRRQACGSRHARDDRPYGRIAYRAFPAPCPRDLIMKLAVQQPFFFPYLSYFELIDRVDRWIVFDTPQYVKWVSRNRVLHPVSGWQYILVPVKKHRLVTPIRQIEISTSMADLPPEEATALEALFEEKQLSQGKDIYREDEPARYFYFLLSGTVSLWHRRGVEGRTSPAAKSRGSIRGGGACSDSRGGTPRRTWKAKRPCCAPPRKACSARLRSLPTAYEILRTVARGRRLVRSVAFPWLEPDEAVFLATRKSNILLFPSLARAGPARAYQPGFDRGDPLPALAGVGVRALCGGGRLFDRLRESGRRWIGATIII